MKTIEVRNLLKKKMCRWIFKKKLNEAYTELNNSYCREVRRVEAAMEHNEKKYGLMKRIFSLLPTAEIIGLEENGNKEELIVVLQMLWKSSKLSTMIQT